MFNVREEASLCGFDELTQIRDGAILSYLEGTKGAQICKVSLITLLSVLLSFLCLSAEVSASVCLYCISHNPIQVNSQSIVRDHYCMYPQSCVSILSLFPQDQGVAIINLYTYSHILSTVCVYVYLYKGKIDHF